MCSDPVKGLLYDSTARHIVGSLCCNYLGSSDPEWEGILKGGVYHLHKKLGVNESVMWGEYFFLEALDAALG
jgi:unsaturated chondroitin disaccharide hydrolase